MIPHFIDLLCRGLSLAALIWGVFSMGFMSAERRAANVRHDRPENSEVEPALRAGFPRDDNAGHHG
jgi:hypothetical protein